MIDAWFWRVPVGGHRGRTRRVWALVDPEDHAEMNGLRWSNSHGYARRVFYGTDGCGHSESLARRVLGLARDDSCEVDHINRDKLDNRKRNLRVCSRAENGQNVPGRNYTSRYRGVSLFKQTGKWQAIVKVHGQTHHLGYHDDEETAARIAREFRAKHFPFSVEEVVA